MYKRQAQLDSMMEDAESSATQEEYEQRWLDYQLVFMEKVPYVFLDTPYRYTAVQPYLKGYQNSVAGFNRFQWISDWKFEK